MDLLDIHTHDIPGKQSAGNAIRNHPLTQPIPSAGYFSVGIHPWELSEEEADVQWKSLEERVGRKPVIALGEAGLDKTIATPLALQTSYLKKQIELSERVHLPMIIHCVKATDELLAIRREMHPRQAWIWHGFRGKPEMLRQLIRHGLYISFGAHYNEESMAIVPTGRLFLETDRSNVPIEALLDRASNIRNQSSEQLRSEIQENIQNVFPKSDARLP